jgi:hypothetical protein
MRFRKRLASGVESLLWNCPGMKEFVADCPEAGRILRPMRSMAGLKAPERLALLRRRGDVKAVGIFSATRNPVLLPRWWPGLPGRGRNA